MFFRKFLIFIKTAIIGGSILACGTLENRTNDMYVDFRRVGFIDERYELIAAVAKLANTAGWDEKESQYQKDMLNYFSNMSNHKAVKFLKKNKYLCYNALLDISVNLQNDFTIIDVDSMDSRWKAVNIKSFTKYLYDFYIKSNFADFFDSHIESYQTANNFFKTTVWDKVDFSWFSKYTDTSKLHAIYSLSNDFNSYSYTNSNKEVFIACQGPGMAIIHEFCHSFGNPLAYSWMETNALFARYAKDQSDPNQQDTYRGSDGRNMAGEYVTRAYNLLYIYDTMGRISFSYDKRRGFPYIKEVFKMLCEYEKRNINIERFEPVVYTSVPDGAILVTTFSGTNTLGQNFNITAYEYKFNPDDYYPIGELTGGYYQYEAGKTYIIFDQTGEGRLAVGGQTFNGKTGFAVYVE